MVRKIVVRLSIFSACTAILLLISSGLLGAKSGPGESPEKGLVTYVEGSAQHRQGGTDWDPLQANENVNSGETVQTRRKTRAEIELDAGKLVRLDENTIVDLVKLFEEEKSKKNVTLDVGQGQVWAQIAALGGDEQFKINSPLAGASVRGTVFNFAVAQSKATTVDVYSGAVEVYNPFPQQPAIPQGGFATPREVQGPQQVQGPKEVSLQEWYYIVRSMQRIRIAPGQSQFQVEDIQEQEKAGEWRKWNEARDKAWEARRKAREAGQALPPTPPEQPPAPPAVPAENVSDEPPPAMPEAQTPAEDAVEVPPAGP